MTTVGRRALAVLMTLMLPAPIAGAQSNTAEMLQRAIRLYEDVEIERSLVILRQIISPQSPYVVSPEQRVEAYKYLGAALALQSGSAKRDSAVTFFRAAIERNPFTDLDPRTFSPGQLLVFGNARARTFAVGIGTVTPDTIDPRAERIPLHALSTHRATLRLELRSGGAVGRVIFDGENDGPREVHWDALLADGRLAPTARYELVLLGTSHLLTTPVPLKDSTRVFIELVQLHEPLEDTIPTLTAADLLPEEHATSAGSIDLLKGVAVAGGALLIQTMLGNDELGSSNRATIVAGAGVSAGLVAFVARLRNRSIPANIAENRRRQAQREAQNAQIRMRNDVRLREARLAIMPAAGGAP